MIARALALLLVLAVLARAAHDLWAATAATTAILALAAACLLRAAWRPATGALPRAPLAALLAAGLPLALSAARAANTSEAFMRLLDWTAALAAFWLAAAGFRDAASLRLLAATLGGLTVVELGALAWQKHLFARAAAAHDAWLGWRGLEWHGPQNPVVRAFSSQCEGTMVNANAMAALLLLCAPLLLSRAWNARHGAERARRLWGAGAAACLLGLVLVNSAWAFACLALGAAWLAPRRGAREALAALAALIVALKLALGYTSAESWSRLLWWRSGLAMWRDHPWTGVGLGNFTSAYQAYKVGAGQDTFFAHSFPVALLAESGLLGFLGVAALALWCARRLRREPEAWRERRPLVAGVLLMAAFNAANIGLEYLANLLACAIFLGAAVAACRDRGFIPSKPVAAVATAAILALMPYVWAPFLADRRVVSSAQAFAEGRFDDALRGFEGASEMDPRSWEAYRGAAAGLDVRHRMTKHPAALAAAIDRQRRAVAANHLNGLLHWELAAYLQKAGRHAEAASARAEAARLHPSDPRFSKRRK